MARLEGSLTTSGEIATGTAAKTILQLAAPSNHRVAILGISISFDGVTATNEPVLVQLVRQSTAGTGGLSRTPVKADDSLAEAIQCTGLEGPAGTWTAEPTTGDVLRQWKVPPTGLFERVFDYREIVVGGGDRIAIRVTAANAVNCVAAIDFEE